MSEIYSGGCNFQPFSKKNHHNHQNKLVGRQYLEFFHYSYFKLIGLSPWSVKFSVQLSEIGKVYYNENLYRISFVGSMYNILLFLGILTFGLSDFIGIAYQSWFQESFLWSNVTKFSSAMFFITILIPIYYIIQQKTFIDISNRLRSLDKILSQCLNYQVKKDYTNDLIFSINLLSIICMMTITNFFYGLTIACAEIIPSVITSGLLIQYVMLLNKINKRFEGINSIFLKLDSTKINSTQISTLTQIVPLRVLILKDINDVKFAYRKLIEACEDIGNFYGAPILISFISIIGKGLVSTYLGVLVFMNIQSAIVSWQLIALRVSWTMFLFIVLTSGITTITEQLNKFLNDLWNLKIKITACNIIPLDRKLLAIVSNLITTYLIIGVQFVFNVSQ